MIDVIVSVFLVHSKRFGRYLSISILMTNDLLYAL